MSGSFPSSTVSVNGSAVGSMLQQLLLAGDIVPGSTPSYELCKLIYLYHPLGRKLAEAPIALAQSQEREISVGDGPEEDVVKAFKDEWINLGADSIIFGTIRNARIYGLSVLAVLVKDKNPMEPLKPEDYAEADLFFNVLDPLNVAGVMMSQDPNSPGFQKVTQVNVAGVEYHSSRTITVLNEEPIYLAFTSASFTFGGRSVYQRALFPLKSYVNSMIANDMILTKLGLLIAKIQSPGSFIDRIMQGVANIKRVILQQGETNNVVSIGTEESVETLNMQNVDGAGTYARTNVLKDIATAADMPAVLVENETMVAGFGEGTEDAKNIARYINGERVKARPIYDYLDKIVQRRAWNPEFFATMQARYPDVYGEMDYQTFFYTMSNSFVATWPNLLQEPDSEKSKGEDVRLKAVIALIETLAPMIDPTNMLNVIQWAVDNFNKLTVLFPQSLELDADTLLTYLKKLAADKEAMTAQLGGGGDEEGEPGKEPKPPAPFSEEV